MRKFRIIAMPTTTLKGLIPSIQTVLEFELETSNFIRCLDLATSQVVNAFGEDALYKFTAGEEDSFARFTVNELTEGDRYIGLFYITCKEKTHGTQVRLQSQGGYYVSGCGFMKRDGSYTGT